jgi:OHCU decarboxylase
MTLAELDEPRLLECCGSRNWAAQMLAVRPFRDRPSLETAATDIWWRLAPADWLEAFSKHPKIGEQGKVSQWSSEEQSGMNSAAVNTAQKLAALNQAYFDKFGWIFIVCATGKSAEEMLSLLQARLPNQPEDELRIAAAEQNKITLLRLRKLLSL